jgi:hypothetical protein
MTPQTAAFVELSRHLYLGTGPFEGLRIPFQWTYTRFIAEQHGDKEFVFEAAMDNVRLWLEGTAPYKQNGGTELWPLVYEYRSAFFEAGRDWGGRFDRNADPATNLPSMRTFFEAAFAQQNILRSRKKGSESVIVYLNKDKRKDEFWAELNFQYDDPGDMSVIFAMLPLKARGWHPGGLIGSPPPACLLSVYPATRRPQVVEDVLMFLIRVMQAYRPIIDMD